MITDEKWNFQTVIMCKTKTGLTLLNNYGIHLEGTLAFRKYSGGCVRCLKEIETLDIHEEDLIDKNIYGSVK